MRRDRPSRRWESHDENDPLAGLVNLFDLWMVFSIAILIVFAGATRRSGGGAPSRSGARQAFNLPRAQAIKQYRVSQEKLEGSGEKLGTAYRLASGEVVCVPDAESYSKSDQHAPSESSERGLGARP